MQKLRYYVTEIVEFGLIGVVVTLLTLLLLFGWVWFGAKVAHAADIAPPVPAMADKTYCEYATAKIREKSMRFYRCWKVEELESITLEEGEEDEISTKLANREAR